MLIPDDEVLWFNSGIGFDKIYFAFLYNPNKPALGDVRWKVLKQHFFKDKIEHFAMTESNFWKDKSKEKEFKNNYDELVRHLKWIVDKDTEFWTHNVWGEYGHDDHILVHQAVVEIADRFDLPVYCYNGIEKIDIKDPIEVKTDYNFFRETRQLYMNNRVWTYDSQYEPPKILEYFKFR